MIITDGIIYPQFSFLSTKQLDSTQEHGRVAQLVEHTVSIREVRGSKPRMSKLFFFLLVRGAERPKNMKAQQKATLERIVFFNRTKDQRDSSQLAIS